MATTPPAMRIKNRWFGSAEGKSAAEQASAMAFIVFRVARQMLERMRSAGFDIDPGPGYFAFLREVLCFLVALADRLACERLGADGRAEFTAALVRHLARNLAENEDGLLGPRPAGSPSHAETFIDLVNELSAHYAEFGADPQPPADAIGFHPDFGFQRYLGVRLEPTLPDKDRRWVLDQVMVIEAPEAITVVQRSMRELLDPRQSPARRRSALSGD